ncbi:MULTISPECIES: membrane protein insertion efficiency factor YidD [Cobetia]|uniref:membrane protein insertion efficiency factor YidD n=1 Tax=Cobetia TaxID=204286 RepID=UPI0034E1D885
MAGMSFSNSSRKSVSGCSGHAKLSLLLLVVDRLKKLILFLIQRYRTTGGSKRWFGIECNFEPTCSLYTYQAIERFGVWAGIKMGFNRIKCCNQRDIACKHQDPVPEE